MTTPQSPIGIFDSGIGGLTVVRALRELAPQEPIVYFGDTARVPYGPKSPDTVQRYAREIVTFLTQQDIKMLVVACNTVSAVALEAVREVFDGPVVDVIEPGARAAVRLARQAGILRIGVIGTKATVNSGAYQQMLQRLEPKLGSKAVSCPLFVPLAEEDWSGHPATRLVVQTYLEPLLRWKPSTLILGCTHYPLLTDDISEVAGTKIPLVSSAQETARTVVELLELCGLQAPQEDRPTNMYYASDDIEGFQHYHAQIVEDDHARFATAKLELHQEITGDDATPR